MLGPPSKSAISNITAIANRPSGNITNIGCTAWPATLNRLSIRQSPSHLGKYRFVAASVSGLPGPMRAETPPGEAVAAHTPGHIGLYAICNMAD